MDYVEVMKDMAGKVFEIQSMFTNHLNHEFVALPKLDGDGTWYFPKTVVDLCEYALLLSFVLITL